MKAGDILYVGNVRIRAANKTSLSIDAEAMDIIIHATEESRSGGHCETKPNLKE
jgi:hypothetical protein